MNPTDTQTFHIPVSFDVFGIASVNADSFETACQRAIDQEIIPPVFDMDGFYAVEDYFLHKDGEVEHWVARETSDKALTIAQTKQLKAYTPTLTLPHYGVAVKFRLAGVVRIQAATLEEALDIAICDEPLPRHVILWSRPELITDAIDHGKQNIEPYPYQFVTFD